MWPGRTPGVELVERFVAAFDYDAAMRPSQSCQST